MNQEHMGGSDTAAVVALTAVKVAVLKESVKVVSIGLFCPCFVPFLYNGV